MLNASILFDPASSRGALVRAAIAAVLLLLLVVVMPRDGEESMPDPAVASSPAAEPDAEVVESSPVARLEVESPPAPSSGAGAGAGAEAVADPTPAPESESPPLALQPQPAPIAVAPDPVVKVSPPAPAPAPATAASGQEKAGPAPAPVSASSEASVDHHLRLGSYGALAAAQGLHDAAAAAGYPMRLLYRVVIGPFGTREAALAAQRRASGMRTIVVAGAVADQWWVQAGVFADADNAESLSRKLRSGSDPVVVQARVLAGPYAGRAVAEQVLGALRTALGRPLAEAEIVAAP